MKKRNIILSSMLIVILLLSAVASAETQDSASAPDTYTLTLEQAIEMAIKDNPQLVSADTKIKNAKKQKEDAQREQREQKGFIKIPDAFALVPVKQGYYVEQADFNIKSANYEKEQAKARLSYDVTQKYYTLKLMEALCANAENTYNLSLENKASIDAQFELGMVAELDVNSAAYNVSQAKAALDKCKRDYDISKRSLLIALQIENPDTELILTDTIDYEEFSSDVDKDIENAMTTRLDVFSLEGALSLAKSYRKITLTLGYSSPEYSAANQTVVQSEYNSSNNKKLIGLGIRSEYNDILNASDSVLLSKKNVELRNREYDIAKIQYDLGMITNSQLTATLNAATAAGIEFENSKLTYKLAVIKYGYDITIGL